MYNFLLILCIGLIRLNIISSFEVLSQSEYEDKMFRVQWFLVESTFQYQYHVN